MLSPDKPILSSYSPPEDPRSISRRQQIRGQSARIIARVRKELTREDYLLSALDPDKGVGYQRELRAREEVSRTIQAADHGFYQKDSRR